MNAPPSDHRFRQLAHDFHIAATSLLNTKTKSPLPPLFLFGRSIELSLKFFLAEAGISEAELSKKPMRHNLVNLFNRAKDLGVFGTELISETEAGALELLSKEYDATHLAYSSADTQLLIPALHLTEEISAKFIEASNRG